MYSNNMDEQERKDLLLGLFNTFAKHNATLQELTEFGVDFIINAAKLSDLPRNESQALIDEVEYLLRKHLKLALK